MIGETSPLRTAWDLCALALILLSGIVVPYQIAFAHEISARVSILVYLIDAFFLCDIALNFRTSYKEAGREISDPRRVTRRYLRTLFIVDMLATLPFDALFLAHPDVALHGVPVVLLSKK